MQNNEEVLFEIIEESSFLVIGGAGTIGQSLVKELFLRSQKQLDVVDISENNLVGSGEPYMMSGLFGGIRDFLLPKLDADSNSISFSEIAERDLKSKRYVPVLCGSKDEAR